MKIVFEPELWGVSPLVPDGKTPTRWGGGGSAPKSAPASGTAAAGNTPAPAKKSEGLKLWDGGSFDFHDILDVINPLQHLPVVNAIYRGETGDEIGAVPRILGSMLYGGGLLGALVGAATSLVNIVVESETGKDIGQHIYTALFGEGGASRRSTEVAASKTAEAKAAAGNAGATAGPAATAPTTAAPATVAQNAGTQAAAAPNAKPITSKADAALQAFVAGLSKRASPAAAAAAANSTIAQNAVRIAGAARAAKAAGGTAPGATAKGDVSTQFHRAQWYQRNRAILNAQAAELAKSQAAAKAAAKTTAAAANTKAKDGVPAANGPPATLQLFTTPGGAPAKPSKAGGIAPAKPAGAGRSAVAGPWVANEIASGLAKYEALMKARNAAAAASK